MIHGCMNCMGCLIRKTRETVPLSGAAVPAAGAVWGGGVGRGAHVPTPAPRSSELSTRMDRSGLTFPMICTAFPFERWASCRVGISPCQLAGSEPKNDNKNKNSAKNEKRKEKEKTRKTKEKPLPRKEEGGDEGYKTAILDWGMGWHKRWTR